MKKQMTFVFAAMVLGSTFTSALAADWFDKYDRHHDHHWSYTDFQSAHKTWAHHHRKAAEARWTDAELKAKWDGLDTDHHGWVTREQVSTLHGW